ncbi:MAG: hypothetical protein ISR58_02350 [Anaerolineales bacterium]|nr:hypothetical protein [Anaerolineales bacterium]
MKTQNIVAIIGLLMLALGACSSPSIVTEETPTPSDIPRPTHAPAATAIITPTSIPETSEPEKSGPIGVISFESGTELVRLSSLDGQLIDEWQFPGYSFGPQSDNNFHFGGQVENGLIASPCIFQSFLNQETHIVYHEDKALVPLQEISQLINMVGAPGKPLVAYSFLDSQTLQSFNEKRLQAPPDEAAETTIQPEYVQSWLYAGSPTTLADAQAIISRADDNGYVIYPLSVQLEEDEMVGVWYTLEPKGVVGMGPIFFRGFSRLYYADLQTGLIDEVLGRGFSTLALSTDQTTVAYEDSGMNDQAIVTIHNLVNGKIKFIDVLPDTHPTGVGDAHFSPSGEFLAWREVGLGEEDLYSIIRIASPTEALLFELHSQEITAQIDRENIRWILIAGWLDDETLLIEVDFDGGTDLYSAHIDGSEVEYLVSGKFLGFAYP